MAEDLSGLGTESLVVTRRDAVAIVTLNRPHKRNALDDGMVLGLERIARGLPDDVRAWSSPRRARISAPGSTSRS